jgi:hypothetical protein
MCRCPENSWLRGHQLDRQRLKPAQRIVKGSFDFAVDTDRANFSGESSEHRLALNPRQQLADAHMNASAEPDMARRPTLDVVNIGPVLFARIAIGGAQ